VLSLNTAAAVLLFALPRRAVAGRLCNTAWDNLSPSGPSCPSAPSCCIYGGLAVTFCIYSGPIRRRERELGRSCFVVILYVAMLTFPDGLEI